MLASAKPDSECFHRYLLEEQYFYLFLRKTTKLFEADFEVSLLETN